MVNRKNVLGHTPAEALAKAHVWHHALLVQQIRLTVDGAGDFSGPMTKQGDLYFWVMALRNLRRAADLVWTCVGGEDRAEVSQARAAFDTAAPGITDLRDVLEHFDSYATGTGKMQDEKNPIPPVEWWEREGENVRLNVGVSGRGLLSVDVNDATASATDLFDALVTVVHRV